MENSSTQTWRDVKIYQKHNRLLLSDSNFAVNLLTKKSATGYVMMLGISIISLISQKKSSVALLTTYTE